MPAGSFEAAPKKIPRFPIRLFAQERFREWLRRGQRSTIWLLQGSAAWWVLKLTKLFVQCGEGHFQRLFDGKLAERIFFDEPRDGVISQGGQLLLDEAADLFIQRCLQFRIVAR